MTICSEYRNAISPGSFQIGDLPPKIIVTAVLCFSVQVYSDRLNGKAYSVIEALFAFDRDIMARKKQFFPPVIIKNALSGYSSMALPI